MLLGILCLLVLLLVFTQTSWFRTWLRDVIRENGDELFTAELRIGALEGNLWGNIQLHDVVLQDESDTLLHLPRVAAEYDLFPLFQRRVVVHRLQLDSPAIRAHQRPDSTWNIETLISREPRGDPGEPAAGGSSDWQIHLLNVHVDRAELLVSPLDPGLQIPRAVHELTLVCAGSVTREAVTITLDSLAFRVDDPPLVVEQVNGNLNYADGTVTLDNLQLKTKHNALQVRGSYTPGSPSTAECSLSTAALVFSEFAPFVPGLEITGAPVITAKASFKDDTGTVHFSLQDGDQTIEARSELDAAEGRRRVSATMAFRNIDLAHWVPGETIPTRLSGTSTIQIAGLDFETATGSIVVKLSESHILKRVIDEATVEATYDAGTLSGTATAAGRFGKAALRAELADIFGSQQFFVAVHTTGFDLATLLHDDAFSSRINVSLHAEGSGFDPDYLAARCTLILDSSLISDFDISSVKAHCTVRRGAVVLDSLHMWDEMLDLEASGFLSITENSSLQVSAQLNDLAPVAKLLKVDSLSARGTVTGEFRGTVDSANLEFRFDLNDIQAFEGVVDSLSGRMGLLLNAGEVSATAQVRARGPRYSAMTFDSLDATLRYENDSLFADIDYLESHNFGGTIRSITHIDSVLTISVPVLNTWRSDTTVATLADTAIIRVAGNNVEITSFNLKSESSRLHAEGRVSFEDESHLDVQIENANVERLLAFFGSSIRASGSLDAELGLRGSLSAPRLSGTIKVARASSGIYPLGDLEADILYADSSISWDVSLHQPDGNRMTTSGLLPLIPSDGENGLRAPGEKPFRLRLTADRFDMASLKPLLPAIDRLEGIVEADMSAGNRVGQPHFEGFVRLDNAALQSTSLGIAYDSIGINILGERERLLLDTFHVKSGDGVLTASGFVGKPTDYIDRVIREAELTIQARQFLLANTRSFEMILDGDLDVVSAADSTALAGTLTILRSRFWLPTFFEQMKQRQDDESAPLLVQATRGQVTASGGAVDSATTERPPLAKNLTGTVEIKIPRNTWFHSPEMNVAIEGELDVVVHGDSIQLFGFVKVYRGTFIVYGKRFDVVEGRLDFQGGTSFVPSITMEIAYSLRRPDGQQEDLILRLRGDALTPELDFSLNNEPLTDADAMSYIIFGRSLAELSQSQKSSITQSTSDLAAGVAASLMTSQLSSTVGEALGLDVIELTVRDNWKTASFTAGKYLTNRLYMRYTRNLESTSANETSTDEVALEYQFLPFLSVQVIQGTSRSTGYDLIFRFD